MDFIILSIGSPTDLGNVTVKMQYGVNEETDLGEVLASRVARVVVVADTLKKAEGETVTLDMDNTFKFEERPYTIPEGEANAGEVVDLMWIVKR